MTTTTFQALSENATCPKKLEDLLAGTSAWVQYEAFLEEMREQRSRFWAMLQASTEPDVVELGKHLDSLGGYEALLRELERRKQQERRLGLEIAIACKNMPDH